LAALGIVDRRFGWPLEMVIRAGAAGWRIVEVPVPYGPRLGRSKVTGSFRGAPLASGGRAAVLRVLAVVRIRFRIGVRTDPAWRPLPHGGRHHRQGGEQWVLTTTRSSWAHAAPAHRRRCCWPARATGCCWSTGRPSPATRSRPISSTPLGSPRSG